jgi:hypothetical protein
VGVGGEPRRRRQGGQREEGGVARGDGGGEGDGGRPAFRRHHRRGKEMSTPDRSGTMYHSPFVRSRARVHVAAGFVIVLERWPSRFVPVSEGGREKTGPPRPVRQPFTAEDLKPSNQHGHTNKDTSANRVISVWYLCESTYFSSVECPEKSAASAAGTALAARIPARTNGRDSSSFVKFDAAMMLFISLTFNRLFAWPQQCIVQIIITFSSV